MFEWDVSPKNLKCTNYKSNEGNCVLLKDCKKLFPELKDVKSLQNNYCLIKQSNNQNIKYEAREIKTYPYYGIDKKKDDEIQEINEEQELKEYKYKEFNETNPFNLPDELKPELLWLENNINPDGSLDFLKGHYTLNEIGVCCLNST